jgi:hypothetical protein
MHKARFFLIGLVALAASITAASSASAATVTLGAQSFTATSSAVSLVKGATFLNSRVTLAGSVRAGTYTGTLGVTLFANIGSITSGSATANTAGWTTSVLAFPWSIGALGVANNPLAIDLLISNVRFLIANATFGCLITVNTVFGRYDRNAGTLTITGTSAIDATTGWSQVAQPPKTCPDGIPSLRAVFTVSPRITWNLTP